MTWATEADVLALTGEAVAEDKLAQANAIIELYIGRTETLATAELKTRDKEWLRRAVAYQAAWEKGQPDLHTRLEVTQLAQDGVATSFTGDALHLAPLAKRAIKKLSWMGSRSTSVKRFMTTVPRRWPVGGAVIDYPFEDQGWWRPL